MPGSPNGGVLRCDGEVGLVLGCPRHSLRRKNGGGKVERGEEKREEGGFTRLTLKKK